MQHTCFGLNDRVLERRYCYGKVATVGVTRMMEVSTMMLPTSVFTTMAATGGVTALYLVYHWLQRSDSCSSALNYTTRPEVPAF